MLNIEMQLCGLLNVVLLAIFYYSIPRLNMYKQKLFSNILLATIVNLSCDILSVFAIHYRDILPMSLVYAICKAYLCMIVIELSLVLNYVTADIFTEKRHRSSCILSGSTALAACGLIALCPISIFSDGKAVYTYNTAVEIVYFYAVTFIMLITITSFIFSKRMNSRRRFGVRVWMVAWIVAMLIQWLNNEWLVVGFATSIGVMVLFICLENPAIQIDTTFFCFNGVALNSYIKSKLENKAEFCAAIFSLANVSLLKTNTVDLGMLRREAIKVMRNNPNVVVFNNMDMNLIAVSDDMNDLRAIINEYIQVFGSMGPHGMETVISILQRGILLTLLRI